MRKANPTIVGHGLGEPVARVHGIPVWRTALGYVCPPGGHSGSPREAVKAFLTRRVWRVGRHGEFSLVRGLDGAYLSHKASGITVARWPDRRPTRREIAQAIRAFRRACQTGRRQSLLWARGPFALRRTASRWSLCGGPQGEVTFPRRPRRREIAALIREARTRSRASQPDPHAPDTLGWRVWRWDQKRGLLVSPFRETPWPTACLQAHTWSDSAAIQGEAGIHAYRMPRDWRLAEFLFSNMLRPPVVTGVVERYGRAVVGPDGWRAEFVVIRKLLAPTPDTAVALAERYPDVEIFVR